MLLGRRDEVLLSDFGIATLAQRVSEQRSSDTSGTMLYMAPEQIRGRPCLASDQSSLGVVVYEWLCGRCPFQGDSALKVAMKHLSTPPQPLRELVPSLSPAVEQVVLRALAKDPQERFARVQDFAAALEQASFRDESSIGSFPPLQTEQLLSPQTTASPLDESFSTLPSSLSDHQLPAMEKESEGEGPQTIT